MKCHGKGGFAIIVKLSYVMLDGHLGVGGVKKCLSMFVIQRLRRRGEGIR